MEVARMPDMTPEEKAAAEKAAADKEAADKAAAEAQARAEQEAKIKAELEAKAKTEAEAKELADLRAWKAEQERAKLTAAERAEADRQAAAKAEGEARAKAEEAQRKRDEELTRLAGDAAKKETELQAARAQLAEAKVHDKLREMGVPHKATRPLAALLVTQGAPVLSAEGELDEPTTQRLAKIVEEFPELSRRGGGIGANGAQRQAGAGSQKKNWFTQSWDVRVKQGGAQ